MRGMNKMVTLAVFIGGGFGAGMRYLFSLWANKKFGLTYWATFIINVVGCLFLGFVTSLVMKNPQIMGHKTFLFLTTGIAGGFTTFSTFSFEALGLFKENKIWLGISYMLFSLFFGLFGIFLGTAIANLI